MVRTDTWLQENPKCLPVYTSISSTFICNSPKLDITLRSITWLKDKQIVVLPYNGMLLKNKKKRIIDIQDNIDTSQYAERSQTQKSKYCDYIYVNL